MMMRDSTCGDVYDSVEADYAGRSAEAGCNSQYLREILSVLEGERVSIAFNAKDPSWPMIIRNTGADDEADLIVLMPMRIGFAEEREAA
jgi:DNA polymerase III sliding clamp (beta) subunit (PCNA family)